MTGAEQEFAEEARAVDACWARLHGLPLIEQTWPRQDTLTAREALQHWAPEIHAGLVTKHELIERFGVIPIVAVVGLLNSGKSSLLASFLSERNRCRVLRGVKQREGSQRFTLWIPDLWKEDAPFHAKLFDLLARVFEADPEPLDEDPEEARRQQNALDRLHRPLVATDPALSGYQLSLLDCPDIQRAEAPGDRDRHGMVSKCAEICAAIFVVYTRNQIEIDTLQTILKAMPEAQRVHVINLIKREDAAKVLREARDVLHLNEEEPVYGAYDYLIRDYHSHAPDWDPNRERDSQERLEAGEPCFFKLHSNPAENAPAAIGRERSLTELAKQLTPQAMKTRRMRELLGEFYHDLQSGIDTLERELATRSDSLDEASHRLRDECEGLLTRHGHVQIKMSPEIVLSMEQSLERTATGYTKWLLLPPWRFFKAAARLGRELSPLPGHELRRKKAELKARWKRESEGRVAFGTVDPEDVQRMLSLWSGATGDYRSPEYWATDAEAILRRFIEEDKTNLTDEEWDTLTGELWKQLPHRVRRRLATSAFLLFGGLLLAFVDGGISLVSLQAMDLLGGLGVAASLGVNLQGAKEFEHILEEKLGKQQVANFHAIVCDLVGVPRCSRSSAMDFPSPTVAERPRVPSYGSAERGWTRHRLHPESLKKIRSYGC